MGCGVLLQTDSDGEDGTRDMRMEMRRWRGLDMEHQSELDYYTDNGTTQVAIDCT